MDSKHEKFDDQETVFKHLGNDILTRAFEGYNACIFAYGQTGSGKSYSMMGCKGDQKGIIPRLCDTLFHRIRDQEVEGELNFKVEVSYMEIYNEKVKDLLNPSGKHNLKVREHNIFGPYVNDLSMLAVTEFKDIANLMSEGNKSRTVAATNMNSESSRSHAVFSIIVTQTLIDVASQVSGEKASKISLVDLAGSERAQKTGATGDRLKEGSNINKSLTTLGLVISALAESTGKKLKFVPYRDSTLTWLLKDNLGGNSKTVMIATLSPAADNYEETLSTLRYADRAKKIVNHAVVNEDPNARIIRELRTEVDELRKMLSDAGIATQGGDIKRAEEKLQESEKLISEIGISWEEKLRKTEKLQEERQAVLEKMGISVETSGFKVEHNKFYLVNLNADPSLNELLVYYLKDRTLIGHGISTVEQDIQLNGLGIHPEHCIIEIEGNEVFLCPIEGARTCVNGKAINERTRVRHGNRILWGNNHFFRINCPRTNNIMNTSVTSSTSSDDLSHDFDFAQSELISEDDYIQEALNCVERQHADDKEEALQRQKEMYEHQMSRLRTQMTRSPSASSAIGGVLYSGPASSSSGPASNPFSPQSDGQVNNQRALQPSPGANVHPKYQQWLQDREKLYKRSLAELKHEMMKASVLVREANSLAQEMSRNTQFSVTLQIPAANLSPNRKRGAFVSEPAVLMTRGGPGGQRIWDMDQFENKIIDLREIYSEWKERSNSEISESPTATTPPTGLADPFSGEHESQSLIGVANIFLGSLFYDVKLDYQVPIISQQGEVSGRLHIELWRITGSLGPPLNTCNSSTTGSGAGLFSSMNSSMISEPDDLLKVEDDHSQPESIVFQIRIKSVSGLPPCLSNFVFCQYAIWGQSDAIVVPPHDDRTDIMGNLGANDLRKRSSHEIPIKFDHCKQFTIGVTEEFIEHCSEGGAISVEVWGHQGHMGKNDDEEGHSDIGWQMALSYAKSRSIVDRWVELTRKVELSVEIQELSEQGDYLPVEISQKPDVLTGGVYQLRQGQSRRVKVSVQPPCEGGLSQSGTLPLICDQITCVQIGSVNTRSSIQRGLDSYQELDLCTVRERWSEALARRRKYLDEQLHMIMSKPEKSSSDLEREKSLIDQWVRLTEERNAVLVPAAGTVIPGAPADWEPPSYMEKHIPVIFLDLNSDDMSTPNNCNNDTTSYSTTGHIGQALAGVNSILPKEHGTVLLTLPFVRNTELSSILSWDSSIHDSIHLNRVTSANERIYLIVKVMVRLSHPAVMEVILRKRITVNIYKRQSITDKLKRRIGIAVSNVLSSLETTQDTCTNTAVTYEIVSNIPKASEDLEDRTSLAQMAAAGCQSNERSRDSADNSGDTYIEKYIKGVSAVESILVLDRLRQEVFIKELIANQNKNLMRKSTSFPNMQNVLTSSLSCDDVMMRTSNDFDITFNSNHEHFKRPETTDKNIQATSSVPTQPKKLFPLVEEKRTSITTDDTVSNDSRITDLAKEDLNVSSTSTTQFPVDVVTSNCSMASSGYDSQVVSALSSDEEEGCVENTMTNNTSATNADNEELTITDTKDTAIITDTKDTDIITDTKANTIITDTKSTAIITDTKHTAIITDTKLSAIITDTKLTAINLPDTKPTDIITDSKLSSIVSDNDVQHSTPTTTATMLTASTPNSAPNSTPDSSPLPTTPISSSSIITENHKLLTLANDTKLNSCNIKKMLRNCNSIGSPTSGPMKATYRPDDMVMYTSVTSIADDDTSSVCSFGSRADLSRVGSEAPLPLWIQVGEPVLVIFSGTGSKPGVVKFIGPTEFASGFWVGVAMLQADGKNDGSVKDVRYFKCQKRHGVFVRADKVLVDRKRRRSSPGTAHSDRASPSLRRSTGDLSASQNPPAAATVTPPSGGGGGFMKATAASSAKHRV